MLPTSQSILKSQRQLAALFLVTSLCYAINFRATMLGDTESHLFQAASLAWSHNFSLDEYRPQLLAAGGGTLPYFVFERDGHLWSIFNFFPAVILSPFLALGGFFGGGTFRQSPHAWALMGKALATIMALISGALTYRLTRRRTSEPVALLTTAALMLASPLWPGSIDYLQHQPEIMFQLAALLALFGTWPISREGSHPLHFTRPPRFFLGGLLLAFSVLSRYSAVVSSAPAALWIIFIFRREPRLWRFILAGLLPLPLALLYHRAAFGSVLGHEPIMWLRFDFPFWKGLAALLINPSKGLLIHSPWIIFALAALRVLFQQSASPSNSPSTSTTALTSNSLHNSTSNHRPLIITLLCLLIPIFILYAKCNQWFGGWSWGYRFLMDALAPLTLLFAFGAHQLWTHRFLRPLVCISVAFGIAVQALGALTYDHQWHELHDLGIAPHQRWLWQIPDGQIPFSLRRGKIYLAGNPRQLWPNPYRTTGLYNIEDWGQGHHFVWTSAEATFLYVAATNPAQLTFMAPANPNPAPIHLRLTSPSGHVATATLAPAAWLTLDLPWLPFQHAEILHLSVDRTTPDPSTPRALGVALDATPIRVIQ